MPHTILVLLISITSAEHISAPSLLQRASLGATSKTPNFEDALIEEDDPDLSNPAIAEQPTSTSTTTVAQEVFTGDWKEKWVPEEFRAEVDLWSEPSTCSMDVTYKAVSAVQRRAAEVSRGTKKVQKTVQVNYSKVVMKEVPVPVNMTQDKIVYYPEKKTVNRYMVVDKIEKRNVTVEVPQIKEVVKNVTKSGNTVYREIQKKVKVNVTKPIVKEKQVNVTVSQDRLIYQNETRKVQVNVTVPKIKTRNITVYEIQIEERERETDNVDEANFSSKEVTLEVSNVTVKEKRVPVNITQQKIVHKVIKQKVQRQVEVPQLEVKKIEVEIPQYRETIREVPRVEIRQRTVVVEKEELDVETLHEEVPITTELLKEVPDLVKVPVNLTLQVAEEKFEVLDVPNGPLNVVPLEETNFVHASAVTNVTEEEIVVEEEIEEVEKIVEVKIEREEIVEVPKFVTRNVTKQVVLWTIREEIVEVPVPQVVDVLMEVPKVKIVNKSVELEQEEATAHTNRTNKTVITEEISISNHTKAVEAVNLIPTPYGVKESTEDVALTSNTSDWDGNSTSLTEEVIVEDYVEQEFVQHYQVPQPTHVTRELRVPVYEVEENIVEVPRTVYEDVIVEVPTEVKVEKVVEVEGNETEVFEREVLVPEYVEQEVETHVEVPNVVYEHRDVYIQSHNVEEEIVETEKILWQDEIVKVPKVVTIDKWVTKNASNSTAVSDTIKYVSKEVIKEVEVLVPHYIEEVVEVPVYEIEEEIVEVKKPVVVEEIVEVPKIIDVERIVEVPTIEYNDTIVEKIVKKKSRQKVQTAVPIQQTKEVHLKREVLDVSERRTSVPLTVQSANFVQRNETANKTTKNDVLNLTQETITTKIKKVVKTKKRVEKLVPKTVEVVTKTYVDTVKEIIVENVEPIYKEKIVQKHVEVPVYTVNKQIIEKELIQEQTEVKEIVKSKPVSLLVEAQVNKKVVKEERVVTQYAAFQQKNVSVPVPCSR